ncbi:MAG: response regulator [Alphaproteobacteria bacterium]|nr:response regulator [Alphaproteobacteria bacterium]MBU0796083.1 response regulator [Alphaproteobacteria bacterium]MBU0885766.1 response regulator [Alphaproteobacteria bacterium]MBU1814469.1 response regulator [Alphaproteobacteria bacterium]
MEQIPSLRRYAGSLTGSVTAGDALLTVMMEGVLSSRTALPDDVSLRVSLFRRLHEAWISSGKPSAPGLKLVSDTENPTACYILQRLDAVARAALILGRLEGFSAADTAFILGMEEAGAANLISEAEINLAKLVASRVLIVEDDALTAMELERIVTRMGHSVIGTAITRDEAVALATAEQPDLILSDVELDDRSSGIDAVQRIRRLGHMPVIFVTAFPDRLRSTPKMRDSYVIPKPFSKGLMTNFIANALLTRGGSV